MAPIRTPLLRMITVAYGHLGYQLHAVSLGHLPSLLRLALNLTLNATLLYLILVQNLFSIDQLIAATQSKPFLAFLVKIFLLYGNVTVTVLNIVYISAFGRRIILLLDSLCLSSAFCSPAKSTRLFLLGLAVNTVAYICLYIGTYVQYAHTFKLTVKLMATLCCNYILTTQSHFAYSILACQHYFIKQKMRQFERNLRVSSNDLERFFEDMQTLATTTRAMYYLLSLPLACFIASNVEAFIMTIVMSVYFYRPDLLTVALSGLYLIYPLLACSLIFYQVQANRTILQRFERICSHLIDQHQLHQLKVLHFRRTTYTQPTTGPLHRMQSRHIRLHELLMFRPYFEMRLFDAISVNLAFALSAALFALQYIVFLVSTK